MTITNLNCYLDHPAIEAFVATTEFDCTARRGDLFLHGDDGVCVKVTTRRDGAADVTVYDQTTHTIADADALAWGTDQVVDIDDLYSDFVDRHEPRVAERADQESTICFYLDVLRQHFIPVYRDNLHQWSELCRPATEPEVRRFAAIISASEDPIYFSFRIEVDPETMGSPFPQIDRIDERISVSPEAIDLYRGRSRGPLPDDLELSVFQTHPEAADTSFLSSEYLSWSGFFIHPDTRPFIESWKHHGVHFHETVLDRGEPNEREVVFVEVLEDPDIIDFDRSTFARRFARDRSEPVTFDDYEHFVEQTQAAFERVEDFRIVPTNVRLHHYPDLFRFPLRGELMCSFDLAEHLRNFGATGFYGRPLDFEIT